MHRPITIPVPALVKQFLFNPKPEINPILVVIGFPDKTEIRKPGKYYIKNTKWIKYYMF
jgi:hypothetical protein